MNTGEIIALIAVIVATLGLPAAYLAQRKKGGASNTITSSHNVRSGGSAIGDNAVGGDSTTNNTWNLQQQQASMQLKEDAVRVAKHMLLSPDSSRVAEHEVSANTGLPSHRVLDALRWLEEKGYASKSNFQPFGSESPWWGLERPGQSFASESEFPTNSDLLDAIWQSIRKTWETRVSDDEFEIVPDYNFVSQFSARVSKSPRGELGGDVEQALYSLYQHGAFNGVKVDEVYGPVIIETVNVNFVSFWEGLNLRLFGLILSIAGLFLFFFGEHFFVKGHSGNYYGGGPKWARDLGTALNWVGLTVSSIGIVILYVSEP